VIFFPFALMKYGLPFFLIFSLVVAAIWKLAPNVYYRISYARAVTLTYVVVQAVIMALLWSAAPTVVGPCWL